MVLVIIEAPTVNPQWGSGSVLLVVSLQRPCFKLGRVLESQGLCHKHQQGGRTIEKAMQFFFGL